MRLALQRAVPRLLVEFHLDAVIQGRGNLIIGHPLLRERHTFSSLDGEGYRDIGSRPGANPQNYPLSWDKTRFSSPTFVLAGSS